MDPYPQHPVPGGDPGWNPTTPQSPQPPQPGYGQPAYGQEPVLLWIGDIGVTQHWVVTPNGAAPLAGSQWIVRDGTRMEERIPPYAIVLAILFALACLLGLLFLLVKERHMVGFVEVTVRSGGVYHVTQIPARGPGEIDGVRRLVHQAQSMAYALGPG